MAVGSIRLLHAIAGPIAVGGGTLRTSHMIPPLAARTHLHANGCGAILALLDSTRHPPGSHTMQLSDRIRTARNRKGWKQAQLATMLGVDRSAVGHWERGEGHSPSPERLFALAGLTGVCIEWLATGTGPMVAVGDMSVTQRLSADELRLLLAYRRRSARAKAALLELAESDLQPPSRNRVV